MEECVGLLADSSLDLDLSSSEKTLGHPMSPTYLFFHFEDGSRTFVLNNNISSSSSVLNPIVASKCFATCILHTIVVNSSLVMSILLRHCKSVVFTTSQEDASCPGKSYLIDALDECSNIFEGNWGAALASKGLGV
jgi:hypothetical protein